VVYITIEEFAIQAIQQVGFPIFVSGWLMLRSDKREEATTVALNELTQAIKGLTNK